MTRMRLDNAQWASPMLVVQQIPLIWKRDEAALRRFVEAALRAAFAAKDCSAHIPPKRGMVDPPHWGPVLYARRHHVENLFSSLKDWVRLAFRRDKARR